MPGRLLIARLALFSLEFVLGNVVAFLATAEPSFVTHRSILFVKQVTVRA